MAILGQKRVFLPILAFFTANEDPVDDLRDAEDAVEGGIEDLIEAGARVLVDDLDVSEELVEAIVEEEGEILTVYRDITGLPTVGAGHLVLPEDNLRVGDRITREQARQFLRDDLRKASDGVRRVAKTTPLSQNEFDALVDLVYNVGEGNVSPSRSPRLNEALRKRDYAAVARELDYTKARDGSVAGGLVNRSERRRRIFEQGDYRDPRES